MSLPTADDYLPGHGDPSYSVRHYDLALGYSVETNRLDGDATLSIVTTQATQRLVLDLAHLEVGKVRLTGARLRRYSVSVRPPRADPRRGGAGGVRADRRRPLLTAIPARWSPPSMGEAGWEELEDGVIVAGQPHGAPTWFPCNDRPDDKASYRIAVTAPTGYHVIANGVLRRPQAPAAAP